MSAKIPVPKFFQDACKNNTFAPECVSLRLDRNVEALQVFTIALPVDQEPIYMSNKSIQVALDRRSVEHDGVVRYTLTKEICQKKNILIRFDVQIQGEI